MMEQAYASDNDSMEENEEYKEPEKKSGGGFFGKIFGGGGAEASKSIKRKRAAPPSMNIGSSMPSVPQKSKNDDAYAASMYQASKMNSKKMFKK